MYLLNLFALTVHRVWAHGTSHASSVNVTAIPPGFFIWKWAWDPTLLFFLLLALLYIKGLFAYHGSAPVSLRQKFSFFCGVFILCVAYLPPIDPFADQLFSAHMVQHLLITSVGSPLIIFGAPFLIVVKGLPSKLRLKMVVPFAQNKKRRTFFRWLRSPLLALLLYEFIFWFWHLPTFYDRALRNDAIHLLEHACLAFAAMNLWQILIDPLPLRSPLNFPLRLLFLLVLMTFDMVLSAALTYSSRVWYAYELLPLPPWFSGDRLLDQQLGGLIMWVPGGAVWLTALIITFWVWARRQQALN